MKPNIAIIFLQLMQDKIISRTHSPLLLYLSRTNLIGKLEIQEVPQFLKRNHKFSHCSQYTLYPLCDCGNDAETVTHFFPHCSNFHTARRTLLNNIRNIKVRNKSILPLFIREKLGTSKIDCGDKI